MLFLGQNCNTQKIECLKLETQKIDSPNIHTPKIAYWKLFSFKILNKVITILNLDTQKIAPDFDDPPTKKIAEVLSVGT